MTVRTLAITFLSMLSMGTLATAQAPDLEPIRGRAPTDADRQAITQWVQAEIEAAIAKDPPDLRTLRRHCLEQDRATGATRQFRDVFAEVLTQATTSAIGDTQYAEGNGALACAMLLRTLREIKQPTSVAAGRAGLAHPSPVVREQAGRLLVGLRDVIPSNELANVLQDVRSAAEKETNGFALQQFCALLTTAGNAEEQARALLPIIEKRLAACTQRDLRGCVGDAAAAASLRGLFGGGQGQISAATQRLTVQRMAELLKVSVLNYLAIVPKKADPNPLDLRPEQRELELLIDSVEKTLVVAAKAMQADVQPAEVAAKTQAGGENRLDAIRQEINTWIGTADAPGRLNAAPFNLPAGLPDVQLAPVTTQPSEPQA